MKDHQGYHLRKKRLRLELPKHGIRNNVLDSAAVRFKTGDLPIISSVGCDHCPLPTHACTHTELDVLATEGILTQASPRLDESTACQVRLNDPVGGIPQKGNGTWIS